MMSRHATCNDPWEYSLTFLAASRSVRERCRQGTNPAPGSAPRTFNIETVNIESIRAGYKCNRHLTLVKLSTREPSRRGCAVASGTSEKENFRHSIAQD